MNTIALKMENPSNSHKMCFMNILVKTKNNQCKYSKLYSDID